MFYPFSSFFSLQSITLTSLPLTTDTFRVFFTSRSLYFLVDFSLTISTCCFFKRGRLHIGPVLPIWVCTVFDFLVQFFILSLAFFCLELVFRFLSISAMFNEFTRSSAYPALVLTGLITYGLLCCSVDWSTSGSDDTSVKSSKRSCLSLSDILLPDGG